MSEEKLLFVLGDTLPTRYDAAISIYSIARKPKFKKMKDTINAYAKTLVDNWQKSFGKEYMTSRSNVVQKIEKLINDYHTNVYNTANRKSEKKQERQYVKNKFFEIGLETYAY